MGASAGLNMGEKKALKTRMYMRQGSGLGHEQKESDWELIGDDDALALPVVSSSRFDLQKEKRICTRVFMYL